MDSFLIATKKFRVSKFVFLLACLAAFSLEAAHPSVIKEEFLFTEASFASCHASTLTEATSGSLVCSWFAGTDEGESDVAIWASLFEKTNWSAPTQIASAAGVPCWNPVLFTLPSQEILLFYKAGHSPLDWSGLLMRSQNGGKSWSDAEPLPAGVVGPVKNRPLLLKDGTLLCGSSVESWKRWGCWIDITSDEGRHWKKSTPINVDAQLFGIIQPALFLTKEGKIKLLARSHQIGAICSATSEDQGMTWTSAQPTSLPNPNSAIDALSLQDGRVVLVYNHSKKHRYPLNVAISKDSGETWEMKVTLEEVPGEYSYPTVIQTRDGKIHITYTWNRERIKHVVLDPELL